jgi:hypothetical protein
MTMVFVSYIHEDIDTVDILVKKLTSRGIDVWIDRDKIRAGKYWQLEIKKIVEKADFFLACFSKEYEKSDKTYMNVELNLAIAELRKFKPDRVWLIPVIISPCKVPDWQIAPGRTLRDIERIDLYKNVEDNTEKLISVLLSDPMKNRKPSPKESNLNSKIKKSIFNENSEHQKNIVIKNNKSSITKIKHIKKVLIDNPAFNDKIIDSILNKRTEPVFPDNPRKSWNIYIEKSNPAELQWILEHFLYYYGDHFQSNSINLLLTDLNRLDVL